MKKIKKSILSVYQRAFKKLSKAFSWIEDKWKEVHQKSSIFKRTKQKWIKKGKKKMLHLQKFLRNLFYFK